ncbi:MAG TPA: MarR family transcriptional regulator [Candidatus Cybelea sp.]|nr:MarR family transcriptional regulator [Candidatus Cybelea sp.]
MAERLHSAAIHVLRYARQADRVSAIGPAQLSALSVLVYSGPSNLRELADAEQVAPPTMTRIVAALRRGGYVRLKRCPDDARARVVEAAAKGVAALEKARGARLDLIDGMLSRCAPADVALLGKALAAVFPQAP